MRRPAWAGNRMGAFWRLFAFLRVPTRLYVPARKNWKNRSYPKLSANRLTLSFEQMNTHDPEINSGAHPAKAWWS